MRMAAQFVRLINLFPVLDQIVEEDDNIVNDRYYSKAEFPLPLIDWSEEEVTNLDILKRTIENRTKQWVDAQIAQLKVQGVELTYGELKDELERKTNSGATAAPSEEVPKSPPVTRSKKRKDVLEHNPKHKVYS